MPRYAISGLPAAYLLLAAGLARLETATRLAFLTAFLVPWFVGIRADLGECRFAGAFRQVGAILAKEARHADVVIVHSIPSGVAGVARYMTGREADVQGIGFAPWVGQLGTRRVPEDLAKLLDGRARARLVVLFAVGEPAPEETWLRQNWTLLGVRRIFGSTILDFAPKPSGRSDEATMVSAVLDGPSSSPGGALPTSAQRGKL